MKINDKNIDIAEAIKISDSNNLLLKRRENNFLLSDYQVQVLNRFDIHYNKYSSEKELLFQIEDVLNEIYDEELDNVGKQISELLYYRDTKK